MASSTTLYSVDIQSTGLTVSQSNTLRSAAWNIAEDAGHHHRRRLEAKWRTHPPQPDQLRSALSEKAFSMLLGNFLLQTAVPHGAIRFGLPTSASTCTPTQVVTDFDLPFTMDLLDGKQELTIDKNGKQGYTPTYTTKHGHLRGQTSASYGLSERGWVVDERT